MLTMLENLKELSLPDYLACLYLPPKIREDIALLYAFNAEIDRIPHLVSEPLPGEIRLQWWRDLIKSGNNVGSGPLADGLMKLIKTHNLPREVFHTFLEAKIFDLYQDPMPDHLTLEGYLGETNSALLQLMCLVAGAERSTDLANACGHGGVAQGLAQILCAQAYHRHTQRCFIPIEVLEQFDLNREAWLAQDVGEKHVQVLSAMREKTFEHLNQSREAIKELPKEIRPLFLGLATIVPSIQKTKSIGAGIFEKPANLSPLRLQWTLLAASIKGV